MKLKKTLILLSLLSAVLIIVSCGTSTGSRYSKSGEESISDSGGVFNTGTRTPEMKEDFDITPYKTRIDIPEKTKNGSDRTDQIWFDYGSPSPGGDRKILSGTQDGFRVLVSSTDNLEEADQIKAEVNAVSDNEIYVDFEPPFYRVKVGDFSDQKSAENIRFKLTQLGFKEAKVIKDQINIFKQ